MWEAILFILVGGGAVCALVLRDHKRRQAWQEAVASCGLQVETAGPSRLTARAGPLVQLEFAEETQQLTRITITVDGLPGFDQMRIRPEPLFKRRREIEIGDSSFDSVFFIEGPVQVVFALLDAEARRLLLRVSIPSKLEVFNGALRVEVLHSYIPQVLPVLLEVGQRFAQPLDVPRRLAENADRDPEAGVRLQNLLILVRELPGEPGTVEALRKACSDASPKIRLRAARELGAEGRDTLLELAKSMADDAVSAEAVLILGRELPFESTRSLLDHALSRRRIRTAVACLEVLGRTGAAAAVDVLVEVMAQGKSELAAAAAAQAVGARENSAAELSLNEALQREQVDLRVAAANALGRLGLVEAVLPLKEAAERPWFDRELRRAARQAIAEIQSRLQGASPGQLSLAGGETGQLSLTEAEAGQLSLTNDPAGQLSFPAGEPGQLSLGGDEVD